MKNVRNIADLKKNVQRRRLAEGVRPRSNKKRVPWFMIGGVGLFFGTFMVSMAVSSYPWTAARDYEVLQRAVAAEHHSTMAAMEANKRWYDLRRFDSWDNGSGDGNESWSAAHKAFSAQVAREAITLGNEFLIRELDARYGDIAPFSDRTSYQTALERMRDESRYEEGPRYVAGAGVGLMAAGIALWLVLLALALPDLQRRRFPIRRQLDGVGVSEGDILAEAKGIMDAENAAAVAPLEQELSRYRQTAANLKEAARVARRMARCEAATPEVAAAAERQAAQADRQVEAARKLEQRKFTELSERRLQLAQATELALDQLHLALVAGRDSETLDEVRQAASPRQRVAPVDYDALDADVAARASALAEDDESALDDHATIAVLAARRRA